MKEAGKILKNRIQENRKKQRKNTQKTTKRSGSNNYLSYHNKCKYIHQSEDYQFGLKRKKQYP